MAKELKEIFDLTYTYAGIDRDMYYPNRIRPENDAEHTFQLALVAWNIIERDNLKSKLDTAKVFKLCLAHDLVEVYSGDVPLWGKTGHEEKVAREKEALGKLRDLLGQDSEIPSAIAEYKERQTNEAKFVYALDKLIPFTNQMYIEGQVWKNHNIKLEPVVEITENFSLVSPHLTEYFQTLIERLKSVPEKYFN